MTNYEIHLVVPVTKLATILEVLDGEGTLIAVKQVQAPHRKAHRVTVNPDGKTGGQLAQEFIEQRKAKGMKDFHIRALEDHFKANGRNPHSASPQLSELKDQGKLRSVGNRSGRYEIVK